MAMKNFRAQDMPGHKKSAPAEKPVEKKAPEKKAEETKAPAKKAPAKKTTANDK